VEAFQLKAGPRFESPETTDLMRAARRESPPLSPKEFLLVQTK